MQAYDQIKEIQRTVIESGKNIRHKAELLYATLNPCIHEQHPDFLCIGAPRTGTTWLYTTLKKHPDIYLPRAKELHFFDEPIIKTFNGIQQDINSTPYGAYFDLDNPAHWRWYSLKLNGGPDKIKGDITPAYCRVSEARIQRIANQFPDIKIIFMIREPVERAWSGVRNFALKKLHKRLDKASLNEIMNFTMHPRRLMGGNYSEIIPKWERYFKRENFLYLFYDDLLSDPLKLASQACEFIGADPESINDRDEIANHVNAANQTDDIPDAIYNALHEYYLSQTDFLEEKFSRDLSHWKNP